MDLEVNGIRLHARIEGEGPPMLLVHGWPHTHRLWDLVIPHLAGHRVIAPDLRGIGQSTHAEGGYDLHTLSSDLSALLEALDAEDVLVAGIDLGVGPAWMLAMRDPRVTRLALCEGLLGDLPGAEAFLGNGPPWWFGFHAAPGLAERVLAGHEAEYLDFFYRIGAKREIDAAIRDAFIAAYTGALRGGFAHYRAFPTHAKEVHDQPRRNVATLVIEGGVVGDAIYRQLAPITPDLHRVEIGDCKHLVPLEQPEAFARALLTHGAR